MRTQKALVAALDQGTTSTRCLLFDEDGREVVRAQREHRQILPRPGWVEHDPMEIWALTVEVVRGALQSSTLTREHAVASPVPGLIAVTGGKYTTYRLMAKDAVDAAVYDLGRAAPPCCTEDVPLLGADGYRGLWNSRGEIARRLGLREAQVEHLLNRYGSLIEELEDLIVQRPELVEPLAGAPEYLKVEAVYAASHEGALHLDDILARRTRISIEKWNRGVAAASEVAELVGPVLNWSRTEATHEIEHYAVQVAAAERDSQHQLDDSSADAARLGAPDVRMNVDIPRHESG